MTMLYSRIVETYQKIEATTKRLEITKLLVDLLKETPSEIIDKVVYLTQGKLYPDYLGIEIGIAEKLAIKTLAIVTAAKESRIADEYRRRGDLGDAAEALLAGKTQVGLRNERLTVEEVYGVLDRIAKSSGPGSVESKIRQLTSLVSKASPMETKYVVRTALGRLRLGVADMTLLDALAHSLAGGKESKPLLEQAYNRSSDLGFVAKALASGGIDAIKSFKVTVGRPIRPMLAERLSDPREILEKMNGSAAAEYKYDGLRIQAHLSDRKVTLFSRRLENITDQFPDLHTLLKQGISDDELILEGEAVPVDPSTGELLPFQLVSQRRGRKYELEKTTEEFTRLMAAVFQQQLREVGIALDIRTYEFATFFSDVTRGEFQLYSLRWIGGNEDPDIFEYVFHSDKFTPHGANRSYYSNPRVDALIDQARSELDQNTRKQLYAEIQRILADELPYINLWYQDNVLVHSKRVQGLTLNPSGNYDFLKTAELVDR